MARPQKNNADYFSHYTTLRNHKKIKILRNKFGSILGYAFWCMILEILTESDGLEIEYCDIEFEMFASELGVSAAEIQSMVDFSIKLELIFKTEDNFIYSESLNDSLNRVFEKRKIERKKSKTRQRRIDGTFKPSVDGVSDVETPHSKVYNIKVKESKVNNNVDSFSENQTLPFFDLPLPKNPKIEFEVFWNLYDKKVGDKPKAKKKWDSLHIDIQNKTIAMLPDWLAKITDKQFQPHAQTFLNNERWNDQIPVSTTNQVKPEISRLQY